MDDIAGVFVNEYEEVEESSNYTDVHNICLPAFIRMFCVFRPCGFPYWMFPAGYQIVLMWNLSFNVDMVDSSVFGSMVFPSQTS